MDKSKEGLSGIVDELYELLGRISVLQVHPESSPIKDKLLPEVLERFGKVHVGVVKYAKDSNIEVDRAISETVVKLWEIRGVDVCQMKGGSVRMSKGRSQVIVPNMERAAISLMTMGFFT